ncbi:hypothetical protein [Wenjunlia tyrosinilytica]|nr:hypothetical protein [Wenjunlia tyrosinilytica]
MQRSRTAAIALAATALVATAGTAAADAGDPAPGKGADRVSAGGKKPAGDGARALCRRAPRIDRRIDRALERLRGPASERGSIARLEKRVDRAKAAGHDAVETFLNDKLTFRKSLVTTLKERKKDLAEVKDWCESHNNGATA